METTTASRARVSGVATHDDGLRSDYRVLAAIHIRMTPTPCYIDISHTVEHGMVTYKGLPAPIICGYLSREASRSQYTPGAEFQIGKTEMVANTGTHIDSPFHRYPDGKDLADLSLGSLANLECLVAAGAMVVGTDSFNIEGVGTFPIRAFAIV